MVGFSPFFLFFLSYSTSFHFLSFVFLFFAFRTIATSCVIEQLTTHTVHVYQCNVTELLKLKYGNRCYIYRYTKKYNNKTVQYFSFPRYCFIYHSCEQCDFHIFFHFTFFFRYFCFFFPSYLTFVERIQAKTETWILFSKVVSDSNLELNWVQYYLLMRWYGLIETFLNNEISTISADRTSAQCCVLKAQTDISNADFQKHVVMYAHFFKCRWKNKE